MSDISRESSIGLQHFLDLNTSVISKLDINEINAVANEIWNSVSNEQRIWIVGNGGSATTAAHFSVDLTKGVSENTGKKISAICLNESLGVNTAWANDDSYELALSLFLEKVARKGDLLIVFSGSGKSPNILKILDTAKQLELSTIGILGMGGGQAQAKCKLALVVQSDNMQVVENMHLIIVHAIYDLLSTRFR